MHYRRALGAALAFAFAVSTASCSWTRFDDVSKDAPVVMLSKPGGVGAGFGSSVASVSVDNEVRVLVGPTAGASGAAEFSIGTGQSPNRDALSVGHCTADQGCVMAHRPAALRRAETGSGIRTLCYAEGHHPGPGGNWSLLLHCQSSGAADLALGDWFFPSSVSVSAEHRLSLASEPEAEQSRLLAGLWSTSQSAGTAFVYRPGAIPAPEVLAPGGVGPSYGKSVAILGGPTATYFVLGEPGASKVWLYRDDGASALLVGCVSGERPLLGAALASGNVDGDGAEDLVVADEAHVTVISGAALAQLAPTDPMQCVAAGAVGAIAELKCRESADVSGCGKGESFPGPADLALAVAHLDADPDGEVLVGVPGMKVRDESSAGAVLVYDVEPEHPDWLTEMRFISSAESGDRLGAGLSVVRQPDRDIFVAGAPGGGKAAVFLCSKLLPADQRGSRCE